MVKAEGDEGMVLNIAGGFMKMESIEKLNPLNFINRAMTASRGSD